MKFPSYCDLQYEYCALGPYSVKMTDGTKTSCLIAFSEQQKCPVNLIIVIFIFNIPINLQLQGKKVLAEIRNNFGDIFCAYRFTKEVRALLKGLKSWSDKSELT